MTDPMDALRAPVQPVDPDPTFAARLRERLRRAVLDLPGGAMTETTGTTTDRTAEEVAWPPTLTPYIAVRDARRALDWYVEVFGAHRRGDAYVMPDGSIGHAELGIGDAVLMLAEGSTEVPVQPPEGRGPHSHTIHAQVDDVEDTVRRARQGGAEVEREPVTEPYGRVAVIIDPFGHRWLLNQAPGRATRVRHGDVGYVTLVVPNDERAKEFYRGVLGWQFSTGSIEHGWNVDDVRPPIGLWGSPEQPHEVQLCYRVSDIRAAAERVRQHGGEAGDIDRKPYGLLIECVDNQGAHFQLWQPTD